MTVCFQRRLTEKLSIYEDSNVNTIGAWSYASVELSTNQNMPARLDFFRNMRASYKHYRIRLSWYKMFYV